MLESHFKLIKHRYFLFTDFGAVNSQTLISQNRMAYISQIIISEFRTNHICRNYIVVSIKLKKLTFFEVIRKRKQLVHVILLVLINNDFDCPWGVLKPTRYINIRFEF